MPQPRKGPTGERGSAAEAFLSPRRTRSHMTHNEVLRGQKIKDSATDEARRSRSIDDALICTGHEPDSSRGLGRSRVHTKGDGTAVQKRPTR